MWRDNKVKVKTFLKLQAKKDLKGLETENDRAFLQRLKNMIAERKLSLKKKKEKV